ncbi:MAG: Stk1 family PASTA domain-containing Ser/Thr kinase [Coriobacteriales bacterium]|nr:Stk1 family PASTA domain-containing Ser/Thr kinase [Coriobacteriales bacterium]
MANRTLGGRYTVQDKIGTGGMAVVYRGLDEVLGRTVAIKIMLPQYANDQSFAARFKQEAQAAAALQSPYIVAVYDWGKDNDTYYIIMEYLRGTDLKSGIRKHGALDCRKVAQIGSQIAQALSVAHRHDIIHRDIKPQNIMVQPDGNIKVMDFGIARAKNSHLTTDNSVLGTAHYVSPEQTQGKQLGPTTDIYSLGIVMYEAATGRVPFDGDDAISVALKQVNEPPLPPSQINPRVDPALESIILRCMQKNPIERYQSAEELYHVLRDYLSGRMRMNDTASQVTTVATARIRNVNNEQTPNYGPRQNVTPQDLRSQDTTTGHYRTKSATEENLDRRHRRNVALGIIVSLLLIGGIAAAVFFLMGRPQTRTVPNLIGLTQEEALTQISQTEYFAQGTVKEEYSDKVDAGKVIDQDPDAGKSAAQNTAINLVISKGEEPAQAVTIPDLTNMSPTEADAALSRLGLVAQAGDSIYSDTVEVGRIAAQKPAGGSTGKAGSSVIYQLSKGSESVDVPYVIGWSQAEATNTLKDAGFSVIVNTAESEQYDAGIVSQQSVTGPAAKGSEVVITVSTGTSKVTVPTVIGKTEATATNELTSAGFNVTAVDVYDNEVAVGNVVWQSVTGTTDKGATVQIGISMGPKPKESSSSINSNSNTNSSNTSTSDSTQSTGTNTDTDTGTATIY